MVDATPVSDYKAATVFYPGTDTRIVEPKTGPAATPELLTESSAILSGLKVKRVVIRGVERDMYAIGAVASALQRQPVTIRKWEETGVIPKATWVLNPRTKEGRRRLWSADQVVGLVKIAAEEGILTPPRNDIKATNFTCRVIELFSALKDATT